MYLGNARSRDIDNRALAKLAEQNEKLRYANAAIFERSGYIPPADVDGEAVQMAHWYTLAPRELIVAIRRQENGRKHRETGYHGKSEFIATHLEIGHWQYGEAGRMATRKLWQYTWNNPARRRAYVNFLATRYLGQSKSKNAQWSKAVIRMVKQEMARLEQANRRDGG
jgi:hypothetical protein